MKILLWFFSHIPESTVRWRHFITWSKTAVCGFEIRILYFGQVLRVNLRDSCLFLLNQITVQNHWYCVYLNIYWGKWSHHVEQQWLSHGSIVSCMSCCSGSRCVGAQEFMGERVSAWTNECLAVSSHRRGCVMSAEICSYIWMSSIQTLFSNDVSERTETIKVRVLKEDDSFSYTVSPFYILNSSSTKVIELTKHWRCVIFDGIITKKFNATAILP